MNVGEFKQGLPPIPKDMGPIAGPPYLGILLNWWLFGILTLQYYLYYINFPHDRRILKWTVHFVFTLEMVQTIFTAADGFHWFVFGFGDMDRLGEFYLANFDSPMMSAVIAFVVQIMYAWRVYHLSKLRVVTGLICVLAVAQAAGGLGIGIVHQEIKTIKQWQAHFNPLQITWTICSALADTTIAATMTWLLVRSKSWQNGDERNNALTKIVRLTIETNVASAAVAIGVFLFTVIPNIAPPKESFFLAPGYVLGKLYSNSFMAMLNNRTFIKQGILRNQGIGASNQQWSSESGGKLTSVVPIPTTSFVAHRSDNAISMADLKRGQSQVSRFDV